MSPKRGGEPKRKISDTAKRRSILVFTEGKETELVYLTHWSRAYREKTIVTIDDFQGSQYQDARRRAQALDRKHELDGSAPRSNPSSKAWRLIETIRHAD